MKPSPSLVVALGSDHARFSIKEVIKRHIEVSGFRTRHNRANAIFLSARFLAADQAIAIVEAWLNAEYEGGRHDPRLAEIAANEASEDGSGRDRLLQKAAEGRNPVPGS